MITRINEAPESGVMYALYVDRVVYKEYLKDDLINDLALEDKLLELHLFDENKEYRLIKARNKDIECVIEDSVNHDDKYEENIFVGDKKKVTVINYIKYDEDDLLRFVNYRLKKGAM